MGLALLLLSWRLAGTPDGGAVRESAPCQSVRDCWLDDEGRAIRRPARYRGRHLPKGDCGAHLRWLRHQLSCDEGVCNARDLPDRC